MWPDPQETADLVTFTEEILNGKLHFLWSVSFFKVFGTAHEGVSRSMSNIDEGALLQK